MPDIVLVVWVPLALFFLAAAVFRPSSSHLFCRPLNHFPVMVAPFIRPANKVGDTPPLPYYLYAIPFGYHILHLKAYKVLLGWNWHHVFGCRLLGGMAGCTSPGLWLRFGSQKRTVGRWNICYAGKRLPCFLCTTAVDDVYLVFAREGALVL